MFLTSHTCINENPNLPTITPEIPLRVHIESIQRHQGKCMGSKCMKMAMWVNLKMNQKSVEIYIRCPPEASPIGGWWRSTYAHRIPLPLPLGVAGMMID